MKQSLLDRAFNTLTTWPAALSRIESVTFLTNLYHLGDKLLVGIVEPQRAESEYSHIILVLEELRRKYD